MNFFKDYNRVDHILSRNFNNILGIDRDSEIDQHSKKSDGNENQKREKESLPNGFECGLKNRSTVLSSEAHNNSNEASLNAITDGKVNGYASRPDAASITNKNYDSNEKNKHE